jgi:hypothetical protein
VLPKNMGVLLNNLDSIYRPVEIARAFLSYSVRIVGEQPRILPSVSWIAESSFDPVSISIAAPSNEFLADEVL